MISFRGTLDTGWVEDQTMMKGKVWVGKES